MNKPSLSRRAFMKGTLGVIAVAGGATLAACGRAAGSCVDESSLSGGQLSARRGRQYVTRSPTPDKTCAGCEFFRAGQDAPGCGHCQILSGPVDASGYCASWAARQG